MNCYIKTSLCFLLLTATIQCSAQSSVQNIDTLAGRFIQELRLNTKEKILVQTNKCFYVAGEELWLKAYVINELSHKYYSQSKTLYVDLVNDKDTAIAQLLLNIPKQQTEGVIPLSAALPEGNYWLRAYTANMLQHDTSSILVLPIYILNKNIHTELSAKENNTMATSANEKPALSFFPEGGAVIEDANVVIGFKATDKEGHPMLVSGTVTDSYDKEVTTFKTDSNGLGKFNYHVFKSRKCVAHVKWNNQNLSWPLPAANQFASQVSIVEEDANNFKAVVLMGDSIYKKDKPTYLLGISRDSLCFASTGVGQYEVFIPKKSFPAGLATLYLFNDQDQVVGERAIYINREKEDVEIKTDKDNYKARDKVTLTVTTGDPLSGPQIAALSVSVTDDIIAGEPMGQATNPYSQLGVAGNSSDNFLLTQPQWYTGRSFNKNIAELAAKTNFDSDSTITDIKGKVLNNKNQPVPNRTVTLYNTKQINLFTSTTTDSSGHFKFPLLSYPDSVAFTIQVSNQKGIKQNEKIIVDAFPFPKFATPLSLKKKLSMQQTHQVQNFRVKYLDDYIVGNSKEWMKGVTVKSKLTTYDQNKRVSSFSTVLTGDAIRKTSATSTGASLLGAPGVHLRSGYVIVGGGPVDFGSSNNDEPILVMDGVIVTQESGGGGSDVSTESSPLLRYLTNIPPDVIDFIEILNGAQAAIYGARGGNGAIVINTANKTNISSSNESVGSLEYRPKSYHQPAKFNIPDYDNKAIKEADFTDTRYTLYWNGHVYTNDKGKAVVSFFTADASSTYTITVSGITASGDIIYKKATFRRK